MNKNITRAQLEHLIVCRSAKILADRIWDIVEQWSTFDKNSIGNHLIRSSDSIGTNITEGAGLGNNADNERFAKIARASLFETKHWLKKANMLQLLTESQANDLKTMTEKLGQMINLYIDSINARKKYRR